MKIIIQFLRRSGPIIVGVLFVLGVWNVGVYNPHHELATFVPASALATEEGLTAPALPPRPELSTTTIRTCNMVASAPQVIAGSSVTISWQTQGFDVVTLNGSPVALNGSQVFSNLQENTSYTLLARSSTSNHECVVVVTVICVLPPVIPPPTCTLTPATATINSGETVTLNWTTSNASSTTLFGFGAVPNNGSRTTPALTQNTTYTLTVLGKNGSTVTCVSNITVRQVPPPPPPPTCTLTPATATINSGETVTLNWTTNNASSTTLFGFGAVPNNGSRTTPALTQNATYTLTVLGKNGSTITCVSNITVRQLPPPPTPVPVCKSFTASPTSINRGATSTLTWVTENGNRVVIDNGIGQVSATGTLRVSPHFTTTYTLRVLRLTEDGLAVDREAVCQVMVTVTQPPPPTPALVCKLFTAHPSSLPVGGGNTVLNWATEGATAASISGIGNVAVNGSTTVTVSTTTTYTLTVVGTDSRRVDCSTTVRVAIPPPPPVALTCPANVTLSLSPASILRGGVSTLTWNTTGVETVRFDSGLTATGTSGSVTVSPTVTTTYTLTATTGLSTVSCPVTLTVTTPPGGGGGGGGDSSPTCELSVSPNNLNRGESATLRWNSSRASDLVLTDSTGATLVDTRNLLAGAKDRLLAGTLRVSPTADTVYTVRVTRGTMERTCTARVTIRDPIIVTEVRDQRPLVSGIAMVDVPHTGFEAGPLLTFLFYFILMLWALYLTYVLVIKRDVLGGYKLATEHIVAETPTPEEVRPDVFVKSVQVPPTPPSAVLPPDLPTGEVVIGYQSLMTAAAVAHGTPVAQNSAHLAGEAEITALENQAHARHALLSSDAVRHLIGTTEVGARGEALDEVIKLAKAKFPAEDGWVVINEERMRELCLACQAKPMQSTTAPYIPATVPAGAGSLAEAIVTGNVLAAYAMIGHRPMFALADAAADLDALYRLRRGESATVSNLLKTATTNLSDSQIEEMITALTSALDGTYNNEAAAVKMAIMKAIKVLG